MIVDKGTERPHTGEFAKTADKGTYICRRCNAELYRSDDKFDAHCGWPSFSLAIPGAIKEITDRTLGMVRVETVCAFLLTACRPLAK
mgnify:CR=1 FL=1